MLSQAELHNPFAALSASFTPERRLVKVTVEVDGTPVDEFEVSARDTFRRAVRPILAHLKTTGARLQLRAIVETRRPFGLGRQRSERSLNSLRAAVSFLRG